MHFSLPDWFVSNSSLMEEAQVLPKKKKKERQNNSKTASRGILDFFVICS